MTAAVVPAAELAWTTNCCQRDLLLIVTGRWSVYGRCGEVDRLAGLDLPIILTLCSVYKKSL